MSEIVTVKQIISYSYLTDATLPKILIVEDNATNRELLSRRLVKHGFEVQCAVDGRSGIALAAAWLPDLVLMDIALGQAMDGWEATSALKDHPATRAIPVIALTAHAMATDRERSLLAGCIDHEIKPVDFARLLGKIRNIVRPQYEVSAPSGNCSTIGACANSVQ